MLLDRLPVTDSLAAYDTPQGPLIPLGELTRLLDLDVTVLPSARRATGRLGEARSPMLLDVTAGVATLAGRTSPLAPGDAVAGGADIYVTPALLERLLPVKVTIDKSGLIIALHALRPLPLQSQLDRLARLQGLKPDLPRDGEVLRVAEPYRLATPPSFDVTLASSVDTSRSRALATRYDIRAGADLLHAGFQAYLGSDNAGAPSTMRVLFERRDPTGRMLGPLGVTRASAGDVFTPTLSIGPRSQDGRGISFSTAPLEQASVFDHIDLRGELPIGYDIELYVNGILRGGQQKPVEGRYEFLAVPLVRGANVIRLVSYGPHGERSEEVRVIGVGGGQLEKGKLVIDGGVAQQDRNVVELSRRDARSPLYEAGGGKLRAVLHAAYGLTGGLTIAGGLASYAPTGGAERQVATLGLRTSVRGFATEIDGALDSTGGTGVTVGLAGSLWGVSTVLRHAEYRGGFVDETIPEGGDGRALVRYSQATMDWAVRPFGTTPIPLTALLERLQFVDGATDLRATVRATAAIGRVLVSGGLDVDHAALGGQSGSRRATANLAATTTLAAGWQLRGNIDFDLRRVNAVRDAAITVDRAIGRGAALRLGIGHAFQGARDTTLNASVVFRLPFADLSLDGDYVAPRGKWRVGMSLSFSLARDPLRGRYAVRRIGAASGGNLALRAFVDRNGDGVYDDGDQPVRGVAVDGGLSRAVTDVNGRAWVTGLGYGPRASVRASLADADLPDMIAPPAELQFMPHAGATAVVMYPLKPQGEVFVRLLVRQADGSLAGLSAVRLRAIGEDGRTTAVSTEYDGSAAFEKMPPGRYRIVLDPDQAARLRMRFVAPPAFVVPPEGGVLPDMRAIVAFEQP